jgi:hypothetical protein
MIGVRAEVGARGDGQHSHQKIVHQSIHLISRTAGQVPATLARPATSGRTDSQPAGTTPRSRIADQKSPSGPAVVLAREPDRLDVIDG